MVYPGQGHSAYYIQATHRNRTEATIPTVNDKNEKRKLSSGNFASKELFSAI